MGRPWPQPCASRRLSLSNSSPPPGWAPASGGVLPAPPASFSLWHVVGLGRGHGWLRGLPHRVSRSRERCPALIAACWARGEPGRSLSCWVPGAEPRGEAVASLCAR